MSSRRVRAIGVALFIVGFLLRFYHYDRFPPRNADADEYFWTWSGMTLLSEGAPRAWSWFGSYPADSPRVKWRGDEYRMVKPWFDHPPLYGVLVGAFMHATGTHDIFAVELRAMRLTSLLLFIASYFWFWALARRFAEAPLALLALGVWAVAPPAVLNGRLVVSEQLMTALAFGGWLALERYTESGRRAWLAALALVCAALPLTKVAALAFALFYLTLAVLRKNRPIALASAAGAALGVAVYLGYGAHFGWALFAAVLREQSARFTNFGGFWALISMPRFVGTNAYVYLPFVLGFFTLMSDLREGRHVELALFAAIYSACIAFLLPWNAYSWYLIPLHPVLAFGLAAYVFRAWKDASAYATWPLLLFSTTYVAWIACDGNFGAPSLWRWIYLAVLLSLAPLTLALSRRPALWRGGFAALCATQAAGDLWYVLRK